jgi:integrase
MAFEVHKARVRDALPPRREPYWAGIGKKGCHVGFRKIDAQRGSWIARRLQPDKTKLYRALGDERDAFGFDQAVEVARGWFAELDAGIVNHDDATVETLCREYVEDRLREKGEACATDLRQRFARTVDGTAFGRTPVAKVREAAIKRWRDSLDMARASRNRTFTALRAALNLAVRNRRVSGAVAVEWRSIQQYRDADQRRTIFLDLDQRRRLIANAEPAVADLITAVALTGARPGELVAARRSQFDERLGVLTLTGKTGRRTVPLSPAAIAHFAQLSRSKLPGAFLLTRADGKPWGHSDWDKLVRAAAAKAELPAGTVLYSLRHSFISEALAGGMSTLDVARLTGTSLAMIDAHYGHLVAAAARERLAAVRML